MLYGSISVQCTSNRGKTLPASALAFGEAALESHEKNAKISLIFPPNQVEQCGENNEENKDEHNAQKKWSCVVIISVWSHGRVLRKSLVLQFSVWIYIIPKLLDTENKGEK